MHIHSSRWVCLFFCIWNNGKILNDLDDYIKSVISEMWRVSMIEEGEYIERKYWNHESIQNDISVLFYHVNLWEVQIRFTALLLKHSFQILWIFQRWTTRTETSWIVTKTILSGQHDLIMWSMPILCDSWRIIWNESSDQKIILQYQSGSLIYHENL